MVVFEISRLDKALEEEKERGKEALKGLNCRKTKFRCIQHGPHYNLLALEWSLQGFKGS